MAKIIATMIIKKISYFFISCNETSQIYNFFLFNKVNVTKNHFYI